MQKIIVLIGPPGCGKGTQAQFIRQKLGIPHVSTGDLLREEVSNQSPLGKKVKSFLESGQFPPEELVLSILSERVKKSDCSKGYILDGFPRTLTQAHFLSTITKQKPIVIFFEIKDETIIARITGRLSCPSCGAIYHREFSPPDKDNLCNNCNTPLIQRKDDGEEVVKSRLKIYHEQTKPVVEFYKQKEAFHSVNAETSKKDVTDSISKILGI